MGLVAVTGASGYIGKEVCEVFREAGSEVIELGRSAAGGCVRRWSLGQPMPEICRSADAVVHLASATLGEPVARRAAAIELDIEGTRVLAEQVRGWREDGRRRRLVFVSSQSARPDAANAYGRSKWAIEQLLSADDEIVIRPGLVYGEPARSVYAMFEKLSRLPVVPAFGGPPSIQPVHVREVATAVERACALDRPPRLLLVGAVKPLTFAEAVRAAARRGSRRPPVMVPIPFGSVRLVARLADRLFASTLEERIAGLSGLQPIDTAPSLAALGQSIAPF